MTDFTQLSPDQLLAFVDKHRHLFANDFDEDFPENIGRGVSGPLWAAIRRKEGFALVFKGINALFGNAGKNADLMFIHVLPEFVGKGIGTEIVEEALRAVPHGRRVHVTCEGEKRKRFFERCEFIVRAHHTDGDTYQMLWHQGQ